MARIYVASSWRNPYYPDVVEALWASGHEVYDFRGPGMGGHVRSRTPLRPQRLKNH